jgi:hypothetical protein
LNERGNYTRGKAIVSCGASWIDRFPGTLHLYAALYTVYSINVAPSRTATQYRNSSIHF